MQAAGWSSGMSVDAIGFRLAVAQSDTTRGAFKVYLENTTNTASRLDTAWTSVSVTGNTYKATGLHAGRYEWQVIPVCANAAFDTAAAVFSSKDLGSCPQPTSPSTQGINATGAEFGWTAPASAVTKYFVMYTRSDAVNWKLDSTTTTTYSASSLLPGTSYQWKVWSKCSNDSSTALTSSFSTEGSVACATAPTGLTNGSGNDTSKTLSWTAVAGATRYDIQFRRQGSTQWNTSITFTNTITITQGLLAGTTYEWRIRTVCTAGSGAYVNGSLFTTTGTAICYAPTRLSVDSLSTTGAKFTWNGSASGTYKLRYRIMETISWTNAIAPMTLVSNDTLTIPKTTGVYMHPFAGGTAFVYNGGGLYIGLEHSRDTGKLRTFNTAFAHVAKDVIKSAATLVDTTATGHGTILDATVFRPETLLGSSTLKDSVEVSAVYALGHYAQGYSDGAAVSARIVNHSQTSRTIAVTFSVKDTANTIKHTDTQNLSLTAGASGTTTFTGWKPTINATDSLIVSVPVQSGETLSANNSNFYIQKVNTLLAGYDDLTQNISGGGFGSGAGLILARYHMNGCGSVTGTRIYLAPGAKGKALSAVVVSAAGTILSQSESFTPDSVAVNNYHHFYFPAAQSFTDADYYVGLVQAASGTYFPVGLQWETDNIRTGAYYKAPAAGGLPTDTSFGGRLMINAEVIAGRAVAEIVGNTILCPNGNTTLQGGSINARYANKVLRSSSQNGSVQFSADMALGAPDVYPLHAPSGSAWVSSTADGQREFIELKFGGAAPVNFIDIYETFNPGAIDSVFVKNPATNLFEQVFSGSASTAKVTVSNRKRITFPLTTFAVSEVRIALGSATTSGYNAIDAVAIGTLASPDTLGTFSWSNASTANAITVSAPGRYVLTLTAPSGCTSTNAVQVTSRTAVLPTISFQNSKPAKDTSICFGDSLILKATPGTGLTWSTGGTSDTIIVRQAGSYTVSYNDGSGCGNTTSLAVVVGINAVPTVSITGSLGICPGGSTTLDAGAGFNAYAWSNGASTRTISVYTAGVYKVTVKNASGCAASSSVTTFATTNPAPAITGTLQFCSGSSTTLDAGGGYSQYSWSTGATTQTLNVTTPGTYSVTVKNGYGCSGTASVQATNFTPPAPAVTGTRTICAGGSTTLTAAAGYSSYSWNNGSTSRDLTVRAIGNYTVTVKDDRGCSGSTTVAVTQLAAPTPTITGSRTFCGGSSGTLDAGAGYSSYLWSTGATTQTLSVLATGTYSVSVTNAQGCTGSDTVTITQEGAVPQTPGAISGTSSGLCNSTGNVYSIAAVTGAAYYVWSVPTGATITAGDRTTSITVSYGPTFTSGSIEVAAANACGQSSSLNPSRKAVQAALAAPAAINGETFGLCKRTVTYSIASIAGATSYTWTVPTGASIVSGQGTTSVAVNFPATFSTGNICVTATNGCGSSSVACKAVSTAPQISGAIAGPTTVCSKQGGVVYSVAPVAGATSYTWTVPSQAKITAGAGTNSITVTFSTKGGNVSVTANSTCGNTTKTLAVAMGSCAITKTGASAQSVQPSEVTAVASLTAKALPNPSRAYFTLITSSSNASPLDIRLIDELGRTVESRMNVAANSVLTIGSDYKPGTYYAEVIQGIERVTLKLVKLP
jgi:hypothetical protein